MEILRLSLLEGVYRTKGTIIIIDVFRAFTCEPLMFHYGARKVILEPDIERCRMLYPGAILIGEHNEVPVEGFDLTNSPSMIMEKGRPFFDGKTVIHRTTSGVNGASKALERSDNVFLASFFNAKATADCIKKERPETVSIVAMGIRSVAKAPEDEYCGDYIESLLTGKPYDHIEAFNDIIRHETAQKFIRGDKTYLPKEDPAICLQMNLAGFALKAEKRDDYIESVRVFP